MPADRTPTECFTLELRVFKVVGEFFEGRSDASDELHADTHFSDDLGADRIDLADLCEALQDEFRCEISELDMEGMFSIATTIAGIGRLTASPEDSSDDC